MENSFSISFLGQAVGRGGGGGGLGGQGELLPPLEISPLKAILCQIWLHFFVSNQKSKSFI